MGISLQSDCMSAARLHFMPGPVNGNSDLRAARRADTEQRIIQAATKMFLADGYAATTLTAVAQLAGVGERTVYVRFGSKAQLLKRAIDVAVVGDTLSVDVAGRAWTMKSLTAATLEERLDAYASGCRGLMERAGGLIAVAQQVEAAEPVIADSAQQGRSATVSAIRRLWENIRADGLLHAGVDIEWVIDTCCLLGAAETYVLMTRTVHWTPDRYESWLYRTCLHLATTPSGG